MYQLSSYHTLNKTCSRSDSDQNYYSVVLVMMLELVEVVTKVSTVWESLRSVDMYFTDISHLIF